MTELTILAEFDAHVQHDADPVTYTWIDGCDEVCAGMLGEKLYQRGVFRFPLDELPSGASISQVKFKCHCTTAGGEAGEWNLIGYNNHGQDDPEQDDAQTAYLKMIYGEGSQYGKPTYVSKTIDFRTTGWKEFDLGSDACTDVENAKSAVNRFSVAWNEEGDNDERAWVSAEELGSDEVARLIITYTVPPPAVGYQYNDGLVSVSVFAFIQNTILKVCGVAG